MFFFVMMTAACCVQAQNEVERVLQSVEQHNTTLVALRHETEAAKVGNHTNLNLPNPEVEFGYLWGSPSSIGHRKDVSAVQSFDFATVTGAKRRLARQQDALADWQYKESRMQLLLEAHHLCLDAIYYNAMCKELMQRKQYAEEITSAQQKRLEQGDINRIEYNQVKLDLAAVSAELMRCNTERAAVMAELQRLNGGEPLLIEATDYPAVAIANDFEAWYAEAEQKSPALAYVKQQIDVANRELAVRLCRRTAHRVVGIYGRVCQRRKLSGCQGGHVHTLVGKQESCAPSQGRGGGSQSQANRCPTAVLQSSAQSLCTAAWTSSGGTVIPGGLACHRQHFIAQESTGCREHLNHGLSVGCPYVL